MKTPHFSLLALALILMPQGVLADPETKDGPPDPIKGPIDIAPLLEPEDSITVLPAEVSLNGVDQPALGRSLSDSLLGGLIAQDYPKVVSYEELLKAADAGPPEEAGSARLAGMLGRKLGVQKVLVPRLIGEGDFYRFTVKEIDTGTYEVLRVFELSHSGDRDGIFGFVPLVLGEFEREGGSLEEETSKPTIKIWTWEEYQRDFGIETEGGFTPPDRTEDEAKVVEALPPAEQAVPEMTQIERTKAEERGRLAAEMVALGKITSVSEKWGFCVIDMTGRKLRASEEVEIREEDSERVYATLIITRIVGDKAIADLAVNQGHKRIFPGDVVFGEDIR